MDSQLQKHVQEMLTLHKEELSEITKPKFQDTVYIDELRELFTNVISAEWREEGKQMEELLYSPDEPWTAARNALHAYIVNAYLAGTMKGKGWLSDQDIDHFNQDLGDEFAGGINRTTEKLGGQKASRGKAFSDGFSAVSARGANDALQKR